MFAIFVFPLKYPRDYTLRCGKNEEKLNKAIDDLVAMLDDNEISIDAAIAKLTAKKPAISRQIAAAGNKKLTPKKLYPFLGQMQKHTTYVNPNNPSQMQTVGNFVRKADSWLLDLCVANKVPYSNYIQK